MSSTSDAPATAGAAPPEACLEVEGLAVGYGETLVLQRIDFTVRRRDIFVVMGESGCGKSTLMRALVGLLPPAAGRVVIDGLSLWEIEPERRAALQRRIGIAFQSGALWSSLTLAENLALPLRRHTGLDATAIADLVAYRLALVGLEGLEELYPHELSGGMRKRAAIARALALDPGLLFLDEPTAGLDPLNARHIDELLLELRAGLGTTMVVVTHELASILTIADECLFLDIESRTAIARGAPRRLAAEGPPKVRAFLSRGKAARPSEPSGEPS